MDFLQRRLGVMVLLRAKSLGTLSVSGTHVCFLIPYTLDLIGKGIELRL